MEKHLATVKLTGHEIEVYHHSERDTWVNAHDCKTEYKPEELEKFKTQ